MTSLNLRYAHPNLYRSIMVFPLLSVALAVNFWISNPTFNPYGIPKNLIGVIFAVLGISQLIFLNLFHNLRMVRIGLSLSIAWMLFWGLSNTQQFLAGNASLQLPILYLALAVLQIPLLIESPVNPMTTRRAP